MGMDVSGKNPTSEVGEYFRNSVWRWHPLWDYCLDVAPGIAGKVKYGHSNDGDGLDDYDSKALAMILDAHLHTGQTDLYSKEHKARLDAMPDEQCRFCDGTGNFGSGVAVNPCPHCGGTGVMRPWDTHYPFDVENVREFSEFLKHCGGFEIY